MTDIENAHSAQWSNESKRKNFALVQFEWLRQVAFDGGLSPSASRVAIAMTSYFSRKHDGWAWMSQNTLARDLGMPVRTVGYILSGLIKRGHLLTKRRGRMETNLYHLTVKDTESDRQPIADHDMQPVADHDQQPIATHNRVVGKNQQSDRQKPAKVIGNPLPTNPLNEPLEEPIEGRESLPLDFGDEEGRRCQHKTPVAESTEADFEKWYQQYPKHVAKAAALKAYRAVIRKKAATPEQLLAGAMRYAAERSGQDPKFTKHPATWLNGQCWLDEPAKPVGGIIDDAGNPIPIRPPDRQQQPWRRRSNLELALNGDGNE